MSFNSPKFRATLPLMTVLMTVLVTVLMTAACQSTTNMQREPSQTNAHADEQQQQQKDRHGNTQTSTGGDSKPQDSAASKKDPLELAGVSSPSKIGNSIDFFTEDGQALFQFEHEKGSGKVLNSKGKLLLSFTHSSESGKSLKEIDTQGNCIGYIRVDAFNGMKIEDSNRKELFKLRIEKDNRFKLKDPQDNVIYKVKEEDYGEKIEEGDGGKTLYKVRVKEGKVKLKSADGKTVLATKADVPAPVLACFGFDKLTKDQQYSLSYALQFLRL